MVADAPHQSKRKASMRSTECVILECSMRAPLPVPAPTATKGGLRCSGYRIASPDEMALPFP